MLLQHSAEKQPVFPKPTQKLGGNPCNTNPGFSEMAVLSSDEQSSLRGCATKIEGGGVRPQTGVFFSGTTNYTNGDVLSFPEIMELLDRDAIVSGGESKASRDPDLRLTDLAPPPFSAPCPSNTDSLLFSKGTTRPDLFLDFADLRLDQEETRDNHNSSFVTGTQQFDYSDHIHLPPRAFRKTEIAVDTLSVASSTTINSTAHTISIATSPPPLYEKTFFDTTPSPTGPSPITSQQSVFPSRRRLVESAPRMVLGLSEPIDSRLSSSYSNSTSTDAMKNMQWRPQSAPKTSNNARSASPLQFWAKKSDQPHILDDGRHAEADFFRAAARDSDDATYVDSVSNHLGKMVPPTRPGSGDPMDRRNLSNDPMDVENRGPQPTITREEYESLPQAIQRKYFSALERLQFAQEADDVDRIFKHYNKSHNTKYWKHRPAHSSPETLTAVPDLRDLRDSCITAESDSSWVLHFEDKISKADLTRDEQVNLIKHLRASVILEAANEAFTKATRSHDTSLTRTPEIDHSTATLSSRRGSLDSMASAMAHQLETNTKDPMRQSLYDSFRWLDEEEDLDLGLDLDEYHANLREEVPQTNKSRRPSFRRHLSISKLPFGRSSMTASRPASKDAPASPTLERPPPNINTQRRLSRTLSVINPARHFQAEPSLTTTIDPSAAHYQDPEARQKLRAYLATPSKFDEAVQYGFPSTDSAPRPSTSDIKGQSRHKNSDASENMRSFLDFDGDEDDGSVQEDASSVSDPDSPKTPQLGGGLTPPPGHHRPTRSPTDPLNQSSGARKIHVPHKPMSSDSTINNTMSSREMTLRMTLTRPDLRANEELIYGWQSQASYLNKSNPARSEPAVPIGQTRATCWSDGQSSKAEMENMFAGLDHWNTDGTVGDKGVMKRIWNKVRRA